MALLVLQRTSLPRLYHELYNEGRAGVKLTFVEIGTWVLSKIRSCHATHDGTPSYAK